MAVENYESRAAFGASENFKRVLNEVNIVCVTHPQDIPAIAEKPGGDVFGEGDVCIPFDGDVVVVVDPAEVVQAQMPGQRSRLRRDPFHHATVAADGINVVIKYLEARLVKMVGQPFAGDGHAHACGDTLPERAGGGLDAGHPVIFGMTRSLAVELAEPSNVVQCHRRLTEYFVFSVDRLNIREVKD